MPEDAWFQKFKSNYLDVPNEPLYPFGYGLSYTSFSYGQPSVSEDSLNGDQELVLKIPVTNTGKIAGKEVVQLYIRDVVGSATRPLKELKGFQKIEIPAGETQTVSFQITPEDLKYYRYDLSGKSQDILYDWEPGQFELMVGTNSSDVQSIKVHWTNE